MRQAVFSPMRKVVPFAAAALLACSIAAPSSRAVTAYNQTTGVQLSIGESISGATAAGSPAQLTVANDMYFCDSAIGGSVQANANLSGHVVLAINSITWSNCSDNTGGVCTPTSDHLPWTTTNENGTGGGVVATSTTSVALGTGSGDFTWTAGCSSALAACLYQGGTNDGLGDGLDHYMTGSWTNATATLVFNSVAVASPNCPTLAGTWTASYKFTLPATGSELLGFH